MYLLACYTQHGCAPCLPVVSARASLKSIHCWNLILIQEIIEVTIPLIPHLCEGGGTGRHLVASLPIASYQVAGRIGPLCSCNSRECKRWWVGSIADYSHWMWLGTLWLLLLQSASSFVGWRGQVACLGQHRFLIHTIFEVDVGTCNICTGPLKVKENAT